MFVLPDMTFVATCVADKFLLNLFGDICQHPASLKQLYHAHFKFNANRAILYKYASIYAYRLDVLNITVFSYGVTS